MNKHLKMISIAALGIAAAVLAGRSNYVQASEADATSGNAARGAINWARTCSGCHNMRSPTDYPDDQWKTIMSHMRIRAGLTGGEARDIPKFLQASN